MIPKLNSIARAGLSETEQRLLRRLKSQAWFYDMSGSNPPKEAEQATHLITVLNSRDVSLVRNLIEKLNINNVVDGSRMDDQDPAMVRLVLTRVSADNIGMSPRAAGQTK